MFPHQGLLAKAKFHVNYKGQALIKPLQQVKLAVTMILVMKASDMDD